MSSTFTIKSQSKIKASAKSKGVWSSIDSSSQVDASSLSLGATSKGGVKVKNIVKPEKSGKVK